METLQTTPELYGYFQLLLIFCADTYRSAAVMNIALTGFTVDVNPVKFTEHHIVGSRVFNDDNEEWQWRVACV